MTDAARTAPTDRSGGASSHDAQDLRVGAERQPAMVALADALRAAVEGARVTQAPAPALEQAAALVRQAAEVLDADRHAGPHQQAGFSQIDFADLGAPGELEPEVIFPFSPIVGPLNPVAPPVRMWSEPDDDREQTADGARRVEGEMTLGPPYVGPPSTVHGGVVALVFDELLGVCAVVNGAGAMTGTLTIRYRRPTPLGERVDLRAWIDRIEGRKVFICGTMHHEGQLTAEAEGIFIRLL